MNSVYRIPVANDHVDYFNSIDKLPAVIWHGKIKLHSYSDKLQECRLILTKEKLVAEHLKNDALGVEHWSCADYYLDQISRQALIDITGLPDKLS